MGGINININQSLSAPSSNDAESSEKNAGLLLSLACVADEISTPGGFCLPLPVLYALQHMTVSSLAGIENAKNMDPLTSKEEGIGTASKQVRAGPGDNVNRNSPACSLNMGFKDGALSDMVKRLSSDLNKHGSCNPSEESVSNPIFVDMEHDQRSLDNKEQNTCMPKETQEGGLFLLGTSGTLEERKCTLERVTTKDKTNVVKSWFDEIDQNKRKGKEKISQAADSVSCSNESVESINNKRPFSVGKRASGSEMDMDLGCSKRFKGLNNERPLVSRGGSFFSWIANVFKGLSDSASPNRPLMLPPNPPLDCRILDSSEPLSQERNEGLDDATGFESFVKALYSPGLKNTQARLAAIHDHKQGVDQLAIDPLDRNQTGNNREGFKVLQAVPLSAYRTDDCPFGEFSPENVQNSTSGNSPFQGIPQYDRSEHFTVFNGVSSSSSTQNCSVAVPSKSSSSQFSSCRSELLESAWIRRLSSKSAQKILSKGNQDKSSRSKRPVYSGEHVPQIQNADPLHEESHHLTAGGDGNDATRDQEQTAVPPDSSFLVGSHNDQKLQCRLNPIAPSPTCKKLEPITSVFAKRLGALRQIQSSQELNAEATNMMCNFCGTTGHDITICPEISSFERDDLLKNNRTCDWSRQSTSLCIRCFRLNHWAVACPYVSLKFKPPSSSVFRITPLDLKCKLKNQTESSYFRGYNSELRLKKGDGQGKPTASGVILGGESSNFQAGNMSPVEIGNSISDVQSSNPNRKNDQKDKVKDNRPHT